MKFFILFLLFVSFVYSADTENIDYSSLFESLGKYVAAFIGGIIVTGIVNFFLNKKVRDRIKVLEDKDSGWIKVQEHSLSIQEKVIDFQDSFHQMQRDIIKVSDDVSDFRIVSKTNSVEIQTIKDELKKN